MNNSKNVTDARRALAIHEAARAVTALTCSIEFSKVSIDPIPHTDDPQEASAKRLELMLPALVEFLDCTYERSPAPLVYWAYHGIVIILAGQIGEEILLGRTRPHETYIHELDSIDQLLATVCEERAERDAFLTWVTACARRHVQECQTLIPKIADALLVHGELSAAGVRDILSPPLPRPHIDLPPLRSRKLLN